MIFLFMAVVLLGSPSFAWAEDSALYAHCAKNWSAEAVGETFLWSAVKRGYPITGPIRDRSGMKAYRLGYAYFQRLPPRRDLFSAATCATFVRRGPAFFPEW